MISIQCYWIWLWILNGTASNLNEQLYDPLSNALPHQLPLQVRNYRNYGKQILQMKHRMPLAWQYSESSKSAPPCFDPPFSKESISTAEVLIPINLHVNVYSVSENQGLTKEGRVRKLFYCLIRIKEPFVRKSEGLKYSKILGILQTV